VLFPVNGFNPKEFRSESKAALKGFGNAIFEKWPFLTFVNSL
jgi:hypothetical protein